MEKILIQREREREKEENNESEWDRHHLKKLKKMHFELKETEKPKQKHIAKSSNQKLKTKLITCSTYYNILY